MPDLRDGLLYRSGLLSDDQIEAAEALLASLVADGIETVRLSFVDQHGVMRGKTLMREALEGVFRGGMAMTSTLLLKDTSHSTVFPVWGAGAGIGGGRLEGAGDVLVVPDPDSFHRLPWVPGSAALLGDLAYKDGTAMPFCTRGSLRRAESALGDAGYDMLCGLELEFTIQRVVEDRLTHDHGGIPGAPPETAPLNHGYQYLTEARFGLLEPILDTLRRNAQGMGLPLRTIEIEFGPSQVEMVFAPQSPLAQADAMVGFRAMVKEVCAQQGLHASFMCRPAQPHAVPSGWHLHQSLVDRSTGGNAMQSPDASLTDTASGWIAGLLEHAVEGCLLSTPTVNGYKRHAPGMLAPDRVQWARDNKGAMLRALIGADDAASRIENRIAEPAANPYLHIAAQIFAGLDGLSRGLSAPPPVAHPYCSDAPTLPRSMGDALEAFQASAFFRDKLGDDVVDWLSHIKRAEWERYLATVSDWEQREYFTLF